MKKTLSALAVLGIVAIGIQSAEAFSWSSLNPAYWGHCPKCEKKKCDCDCQKKCDPCTTGAAAPCDPCAKKKQSCDPCQKVKKCDPCEKKTQPCDPCQKVKKCDPCTTGAATPCDPCQKIQKQPCDPCNQLQNMTK